MYEYIKALYLRFFREPECNELRQKIYETQQELRSRLGREEDCTGELRFRVPAGLGYGPGTRGPGVLLL